MPNYNGTLGKVALDKENMLGRPSQFDPNQPPSPGNLPPRDQGFPAQQLDDFIQWASENLAPFFKSGTAAQAYAKIKEYKQKRADVAKETDERILDTVTME